MLLVAVVAAEEVAVVLRLVVVVAGLMLRWAVLWGSWPGIRTAC